MIKKIISADADMYHELRNDEISLRFRELFQQAPEAIDIEEIDDSCLRRLEDLLKDEETLEDCEETATTSDTSPLDEESTRRCERIGSFLSFETLWEMSKHMNVKTAAQSLNMSGTTFKLTCRRLGIPKWKYRTFQSYYALLESEASSEKDKEIIRKIIDDSASHRFSFARGEYRSVRKAMRSMYRTTHAKRLKSKVTKGIF